MLYPRCPHMLHPRATWLHEKPICAVRLRCPGDWLASWGCQGDWLASWCCHWDWPASGHQQGDWLASRRRQGDWLPDLFWFIECLVFLVCCYKNSDLVFLAFCYQNPYLVFWYFGQDSDQTHAYSQLKLSERKILSSKSPCSSLKNIILLQMTNR